MNDDDAIGKLARFTLAPGGLDRDEMLFRAGRASAKPNRGWKAAVGVLAGTQAATLAFWLSTVSHPPASTSVPAVAAPTESAPPSAPMSPAIDPSSYLALSHRWDGEVPIRSAAIQTSPHRSEPVLTAGWRGELPN